MLNVRDMEIHAGKILQNCSYSNTDQTRDCRDEISQK